ncbi:MAG TPA: septum formation family protein, partial [Acidimicrobiales bacterium]|nr:septum formation family protein [Acidimicrobiales bacterium]
VVALRARRGGLRLAGAALVIAVIAVLAGIGVAGAKAWGGDSNAVKYSDLVPGDCLKKPGANFETTERVDCAKPHDLEVFALVDDPAPRGAKYPGRDLMDREANVACPPQFESYVGVPFDQSQLSVTFFVPVKATWESNSRRLLCTVSAKTGQLTGSVKGSKR